LRDRRADILPLAEFFLSRAQRRHDMHVTGLSGMAVRALIEYDWPGNVRELENLIERSLLLTDDGDEIGVEHLGLPASSGSIETTVGADGHLRQESGGDGDWIDTSLREIGSIDGVERALIERALLRTGGNISAAARILDISRATLDYRIRTKDIPNPKELA
jgi:DNA-binding NtrC family response regulator